MNKNPLIYHIYWGTAGNAGLYLDEIYQTLKKDGYRQKVFVNYYYPFDYGEKVFFRITEMEHCRFKGIIRKIIQALEFIYALVMICIFIYKDNPNIVNYSYVSKGNRVLLFFLKQIKRLCCCKLIITCHDVIPIIDDRDEYNKEIAIKKRIFSLADYYLVHTESSKKDLQDIFDISENLILMHIFPLMDLAKFLKSSKDIVVKYDFLFIGHMRIEKGVNVLIDAWAQYHTKYPKSHLCIAGNPNYYKDYLEKRKKWCFENGIDLKLGFINDDEYINIVKSSRCIVFPYTGGTNSGVISTVVSLGKDVITSDLNMFRNNPFVPKKNMFETGRVDSLVERMIQYNSGELVSDSRERLFEYRKMFDDQVRKVYSSIL